MVVAVQTWELHLPSCQSLKDKRAILQSLLARLRRGQNLSVAESEHQDLWQRAEIAGAVVGSDRGVVEGILRAADRMVEETDGVRIIESATSWL